MKVFHTADWHFREKDHDEIYKCVRFIADKAVEENPDLICISGDMTDSRLLNLDSRSARSIFSIVQSMLDVAPVAIIIGTPSHDGKAALALRACRGEYPILVSDMPGQHGYNKLKNVWCEIVGQGERVDFIVSQIPQPTKQFFINDMAIKDTEKAIGNAMGSILAAFGIVASKFGNVPHIANGHGQIGGAFISDTQQLIGNDIEVSRTQLKALNADVVCYGHIHKPQDMGDGFFYSGSPTRMNHGETEKKGFYIHHIGDKGTGYTHSEFIKTPAREMVNIKVDYTDNSQVIPLHEYLKSMENMGKDLYRSCYVKWTLKGWQDDLVDISQEKIKRSFLSSGAEHVIINIIRVPRETVRAERVLDAETLPDKLKAMAELRGEEITDSILYKAKRLESGNIDFLQQNQSAG